MKKSFGQKITLLFGPNDVFIKSFRFLLTFRGPIPESLVEKNSLTFKISVIDTIANAFPRKFVSQRNLEGFQNRFCKRFSKDFGK